MLNVNVAHLKELKLLRVGTDTPSKIGDHCGLIGIAVAKGNASAISPQFLTNLTSVCRMSMTLSNTTKLLEQVMADRVGGERDDLCINNANNKQQLSCGLLSPESPNCVRAASAYARDIESTIADGVYLNSYFDHISGAISTNAMTTGAFDPRRDG